MRNAGFGFDSDSEYVGRGRGFGKGPRRGPGGPGGFGGFGGGPWGHHPGSGWGEWPGEAWGRGPHGRGGPPPWVAGLLGLDAEGRKRGPRARRGDVRSAIVDVLARAEAEGEHVNGYQVIQRIAERSEGAWRPSPGSVYPTIQQLEDEGLVESDEEHGRRAIRLTAAGTTYAADHADELAAVWRPFDRAGERGPGGSGGAGGPGGDWFTGLRSEVAQVMPAVWQIATAGTVEQREAATEILADTRRRLYGLLADGPAESDTGSDEDGPDSDEDAATP